MLPATSAVVDMGDRFLALGHFRFPGTASKLEFVPEFAQLISVERGLVANEREFLSWDQGIEATGLDPAALR